MNCDVCGDNRYELIDKAKKRLVEATNIEDRPEEMAVLDGMLLRFWQMGWLDPASKIISLRETVGECREQNAKLREQIHWLKKGDVLHVLTDQELADQQRHEREMQASIDALEDENARLRSCLSDDAENARQIMGENAKLREVIDDITEVVEVSDPALVEFIAKRMQKVRIEVK